MTGGEIMAVVGFFLTVAGAAAAVWWRIEGKVKVAEDKADKVNDALAAHKLHVAETYTTKAGLAEQTSQIMRAIEGVIARIDGLSDRFDRIVERNK